MAPPPHPALAGADPLDLLGTLARQRAHVDRLAAVAGRLARAGRPSAAAAAAQAAAESAWLGHCGLHASDQLEDLLVELAADVDDLPAVLAPAGPDDAPRVLVVLTQGYETGGHTRQAERMIANLASLAPSLALTAGREVPGFLRDAVEHGGGRTHELALDGCDVLTRAARLRALIRCHDVVLVMTHPWDATPILAAAGLQHDGVVLVTHADHTFWLGRVVANVVADPRASAARLSVERRGVEPLRSLLLPLPLAAPSEPRWRRPSARAHLGLADDAIVLVTVGSTDKYGADGDADWFALVHPAVARDPRVELLAVGCERRGGFAALEAATAGRARAVGRQSDVEVYLAAADVYLDSFPFSGANATLEAGLAGLPVLKLVADPEGGEGLFSFDYPGLVGARLEARTPERFRALLDTLVADDEVRRDAGDALRRRIEANHGATAWQAAFGAVLARLTELAGRRPGPRPTWTGPVQPADRWIARWQVLGELTPPPSWCLAHQAEYVRAGESAVLRDPALQRWVELGTETLVGVAVAARGGAPALVGTLEGVLEASAGVGPLAVSVVDCGLDVDAREVLEGLRDDVVVCRGEGAPADVAWSTVLAHTDGDAVVVLPSGLRLEPGALAALVEALVEQPDVDGVVATGNDLGRPTVVDGLAAMAVRRLAALVGGELTLGAAPGARARPTG